MMRTGYCRAPGGGSGNGHRTQNRLPASGDRLPDLLEAASFKVSGAGLTDLEAQAPEPFLLAEGAESPLAGHRTASSISTDCEFRLIPVRRNFRAWICKVTPADCACQAGNTTGCIPSNDGLDAGLGPGFPH